MSADPGRVIGSYEEGKSGSLLVFLAGIHGNEPAGVKALERVFSKLDTLTPEFKGKVLGLCGNCRAMAEGRRYIDQDLNRLWGHMDIARIRLKDEAQLNNEERELLDLLAHFELAISSQAERIIFIDLHTTSGVGGFFTIITQKKENRVLAEYLQAPIIFNLVDELQVTTSNYFDRKGITNLTFEAGQHNDPQSIDLHEAAIWVLLEACGCLSKEEIPGQYETYMSILKANASKLPTYLDFRYRHNIGAKDEFIMNPGYRNFSRIEEGEALAHDKNGTIYAPLGGIMLMPLYQQQGADGFFITQELTQAPI